ncbi:hypothetical protein JCM5296_003096 [Sporobolomyces johnsonii]
MLWHSKASLVSGENKVFSYAPSFLTPTDRAIGTLPRQVPGTLGIQFDQVTRAMVVDGGSFTLEVFDPNPWLLKFWTSKDGREWAKNPTSFGTILTSTKDEPELRAYAEYVAA